MTTVTTVSWIDSLFIGETVGDYVLGPLRGHGQFGLVFEAEHVANGTHMAVKILNPQRLQAEHVIDFDNEGTMLEKLVDCDGAVTMHSRGQFVIPAARSGSVFDMSLPFQILSLAEGTLTDLCDSPEARARLTMLKRLQLWRSAVLSLMRVHAGGVAHRDVKAENCLVFTDDAGQPTVRFGDFGRGKDLVLTRSRPEDAYVFGRGDPFHAPPEAVFFQAGATLQDFIAADYYGLGSIFVELLTGFSMTQISISDIAGARAQAAYDFEKGRARDLTVLSARHDLVIDEVAKLLPTSIRPDAKLLLSTLCHPVASERLVRGPFRKDKNDRNSLSWVLRRIDIMTKRIKIDERIVRRAHERNS